MYKPLSVKYECKNSDILSKKTNPILFLGIPQDGPGGGGARVVPTRSRLTQSCAGSWAHSPHHSDHSVHSVKKSPKSAFQNQKSHRNHTISHHFFHQTHLKSIHRAANMLQAVAPPLLKMLHLKLININDVADVAPFPTSYIFCVNEGSVRLVFRTPNSGALRQIKPLKTNANHCKAFTGKKFV